MAKSCGSECWESLEALALALVNEKLIALQLIDDALEKAAQVNCGQVDCRHHYYLGRFEICAGAVGEPAYGGVEEPYQPIRD